MASRTLHAMSRARRAAAGHAGYAHHVSMRGLRVHRSAGLVMGAQEARFLDGAARARGATAEPVAALLRRWYSTSRAAAGTAHEGADVRNAAEAEEAVLDALRAAKIMPPHTSPAPDLVAAGAVQGLAANLETGVVSCRIGVPHLAVPYRAHLFRAVDAAVSKLPWVKDVKVTFVAQKPRSKAQAPQPGLRNVARIIAVSSCKGGTGKSTVATNLALSLKGLGARVGLLDADIYGPSLPTLLNAEAQKAQGTVGQALAPVMLHGMPCMSFGFVSSGDSASGAVLRGPMASKIVQQLAGLTTWGDLDFLVIDLPPGTGDINLTLCQELPITAAVVVTTPSKLSKVDVMKGLDMFNRLRVQTIAIVENMAYFTCEHGTTYYPFGPSLARDIAKTAGVPVVVQFPLDANLVQQCETGNVLSPSSVPGQQFQGLAAQVVEQVTELESSNSSNADVDIIWTPEKRQMSIRVIDQSGAMQVPIAPKDLRAACACAACIDELTGRQLLKPDTIPVTIEPTKIQRKGNYAVGVEWSDGHTSSIYTFAMLRKVAQAKH